MPCEAGDKPKRPVSAELRSPFGSTLPEVLAAFPVTGLLAAKTATPRPALSGRPEIWSAYPGHRPAASALG